MKDDDNKDKNEQTNDDKEEKGDGNKEEKINDDKEEKDCKGKEYQRTKRSGKLIKSRSLTAWTKRRFTVTM